MHNTCFHAVRRAGILGCLGFVLAACSQHMRIRSEPSGARVYLNNVDMGMAPLDVSVPEGAIRLRLEKKGYESRSEELTVRPTSEVNGCLVPAPTLPAELFYRLRPAKTVH